MKYLPKTYVFTDPEGWELSYSDLMDRIEYSMYLTFRFSPSKKSVRILSVMPVGFHSENYHIYVLFVLLDTKCKGLCPKRFILDFFTDSVELA